VRFSSIWRKLGVFAVLIQIAQKSKKIFLKIANEEKQGKTRKTEIFGALFF
jgi:hypothetical protein